MNWLGQLVAYHQTRQHGREEEGRALMHRQPEARLTTVGVENTMHVPVYAADTRYTIHAWRIHRNICLKRSAPFSNKVYQSMVGVSMNIRGRNRLANRAEMR